MTKIEVVPVVADDFETWLSGRPKWLQTAARMLIDSKRQLTQDEIKSLARLCKLEAKNEADPGFLTVAPGTLSQVASAEAKEPSPLPAARSIGVIEPVATFYGAMPTGATVSETGRIFVNFPRWGDEVPYTVAEWRNGKSVPYPNAQINRQDNTHPSERFLSVQSVVADGRGRLWVLDTAAPEFSHPVSGGAKLVAIDLATDKVVKTVIFPSNVIDASTYVNDVRLDFRVGREGVAYVTDSSPTGKGGIIVIDLATGKTLKRLVGHISTSADAEFVAIVEGKQMLFRNPDGTTKPFTIASDGIALSPDGTTLYYSPLTSRRLYSVPTALLRDPAVSEERIAAAVIDLGDKGASDGLEADAAGNIYASDYEHNAIHRLDSHGRWRTVVQDPRVLWPDTLSIGPDGYLYFTANQLHRQAGFNEGVDVRQKPYVIYRTPVKNGPASTR